MSERYVDLAFVGGSVVVSVSLVVAAAAGHWVAPPGQAAPLDAGWTIPGSHAEMMVMADRRDGGE